MRLDKLNDQSRKDNVVTFEQLGVDRLFVDESHNYKNLFLYTKNEECGRYRTDRSAEVLRYVCPSASILMRLQAARCDLCDWNTYFQQHDGALYEYALSSVWNASEAGTGTF